MNIFKMTLISAKIILIAENISIQLKLLTSDGKMKNLS